MTWQAWFTIGVLGLVLVLLVSGRVGTDVAIIGGVTLLMLFGVLTPKEAISGMANEGMITVAVMYVIVCGLQETGGVSWLGPRLLGRPQTLLGAQLRLLLPVTGLSAFMNNTPLVAMFIPAVSDWAKTSRLSPSKLMIPLSYAAILGGTITVIGTSTNLVVRGLWLERFPDDDLGFFEIGKVGLPAALVGIAYIAIFSRFLLPDRKPALNVQDDARQYTVEMIVEPASAFVGRSIEDAGLRRLVGVYLAEIERDGELLPTVTPQTVLQAGDRLVFVGVVDSIVDLQRMRGLKPATDQVFKLNAPRPQRCLMEAVVSDSCRLVGKSIRDGRFRSVYNAVVLAVARNGQRITDRKIGDIVLHTGDTLLLEAHHSFAEQMKNSRDFYLVSRIEGSNPVRHERAIVAVGILLAMIVAASAYKVPMLVAAMVAAGAMIITRCCTGNQARRSVDWQVLLVIAASFALGRALYISGAAEHIAREFVAVAAGNPLVSLAVVYGVTMVFTELIGHNAAAALCFPIAFSVAQQMDVNFMPFAMTIMMAASASFTTPIGYQTNLMVMGPGGYKFTDYVRVGLPLNLLIWGVTVALAPRIWPF